MSKVKQEQEIGTEVSTMDEEYGIAKTEFNEIETKKLGVGERIKQRMHEFGERHPKTTTALKAIGVFSVAFIGGFAASALSEHHRKQYGQDSDLIIPFDEDVVETDETVSDVDVPDNISGEG